MSAELIPELYKKIHKEFEDQISKNESVQKFYVKLRQGKTTAEDVSAFSGDVGECASMALCLNLSEDVFPDGVLQWDMAEGTIKKLLIDVHNMIMDVAVSVQKLEDEKINIRLNPIRSDFPVERVDDLLYKLISILKRDE